MHELALLSMYEWFITTSFTDKAFIKEKSFFNKNYVFKCLYPNMYA